MDNEVLKAIINTNHSIIIGLDHMNICRIFSRGAEHITGYSQDEVIGKKWNEIFLAQEDQAKLDVFWRAAWEVDYDRISEMIDENPDATESWEVVSGKEVYNMIGPLQVRSGEIKSIFWQNTKIDESENINKHLLISIGVDITEQRKAEKIILHQNLEYEALNEELRQTNEQLYAAKEEAEEANRLKTEFLNNLSHEVRTPMNGIIGFAELLNDPDLNIDTRREFTGVIRNNSRQLLKIIDDILEISFLKTQMNQIHEVKFNPNAFLDRMYSVFRSSAEKKDVSLYLKKALPDDQAYIFSDRNKLDKILNNLLGNALKFTDSGYIELGYFPEGEKLVFYVKDTGIGIDPKYHKAIFLRFSQGHNDISYTYGGLGLGLSIAQENAQLLGGIITLESELDKGSVFYLRIPYKPYDFHPDKSVGQIFEDKAVKEQYTVLIAEDEEINYLYLEVLFADKIGGNYKLLHAWNGKEAVDLCCNQPDIDLVLMDIKMPVMNGCQATEIIKSKFPELPVIAQTAYSTESDVAMALQYGCNDFISKPISKIKLADLLHQYLHKN